MGHSSGSRGCACGREDELSFLDRPRTAKEKEPRVRTLGPCPLRERNALLRAGPRFRDPEPGQRNKDRLWASPHNRVHLDHPAVGG